MREDHGVDEADLARQRTSKGRADRAQEIADRRDVPQGRLGRVEFRVHVVVGQAVGDHAVRERVDHQQEPQPVHDAAGRGGDGGEVVGEPLLDAGCRSLEEL